MTVANPDILIATLVAFLVLGYLLSVKRIDSNNTLYFACVIVLLYIIAVVALLSPAANDKVLLGLISIGSAIIGFLSRGVVDAVRDERKSSTAGARDGEAS